MISNYIVEKNINDYVTRFSKYVLRDPEFYKKDEGYKYQAVATFRKHFDLNAHDFAGMLKRAVSETRNLIESGSYYPRKMLLIYTDREPEFIRKEFKKLFSKEGSVYDRMDGFINDINEHFPQDKKQSYFDYRFVSFFLAAYQPEKYIHVKSKEYKAFAGMVGYNLIIAGAPGQRYRILLEFADLIRGILKANQEFRKVHKRVTEPFEYKDPSLSWGTDDFIFNVARRLGSAFNEEAKRVIKRNVDIQQNKKEELEDMLVEDKIVEIEGTRSREELVKLAHNFKPIGKPYTEKEGSYRVRQDNAAQKERIKILEDYSCQICGFTLEYTTEDGKMRKFAHADHIVDKSNGGTEEADNLWVLCPNCHAKKTLGVITVKPIKGEIRESGKMLHLHHNNHLSWYMKD